MEGLKVSIRYFVTVLIITLLLNSSLFGQDPKQSVINVSKITSWVANNGYHNWVIDTPNGQWNGTYPNGLPVGVIFSEGICWGGLVYDGQDQKVRVNGNTYGSGCSPNTRLYRVRTDYYKANLTNDAASFFNKDKEDVTNEDVAIVKTQYEKDWNEWPADKGAPFYDVDKNGSYDPNIDIPGVPGALQTLWINYNDNNSRDEFNSIPIGLEVQETYWAYDASTIIGDVIYKKVDIIYKGTSVSTPESRIDSMYICQWSDTDIGIPTNDFNGCDTTLNLAYAYNSKDPDADYIQFDLAPPAVGYCYLQGVSKFTGNYSDSAVINFKWRKGYRYFHPKPLTVAILHRTGGTWPDPTEGSYDNGTLAFYNLMSGYLPRPVYPNRLKTSEFIGYGTYMLSGDPITGIGEIDGITEGPGDRRMWLMNGPFSMNLGDTAEVVLALVGGIGKSHLSSISILKYNVGYAKLFFDFFIESLANGIVLSPSVDTPDTVKNYPSNYALYQNYPNPFNSTTNFIFDQPKDAYVTLSIYNVLGEKVADVINKYLLAGKHTITYEFNGLPSGIYFARIKFNNNESNIAQDKLMKTMKLLLIK